jgi:hypothetical protein
MSLPEVFRKHGLSASKAQGSGLAVPASHTRSRFRRRAVPPHAVGEAFQLGSIPRWLPVLQIQIAPPTLVGFIAPDHIARRLAST